MAALADGWVPFEGRVPDVRPGQVHVWRISLDIGEPEHTAIREFLTPDERARAASFHQALQGRRFAAARGRLRLILSRYLGHDPRELPIAYGAQGKPFLPGEPALTFSLSHSQGLALVAVTHEREVGVDLEQIRPDLQMEAMAHIFLSDGERAGLPRDGRSDALFVSWTRKEAYLKAIGGGFSLPLQACTVPTGPRTTGPVVIPGNPEVDGRCWTLRDLWPGMGYVGAVVVEGELANLWCCSET